MATLQFLIGLTRIYVSFMDGGIISVFILKQDITYDTNWNRGGEK